MPKQFPIGFRGHNTNPDSPVMLVVGSFEDQQRRCAEIRRRREQAYREELQRDIRAVFEQYGYLSSSD